MPTDATRAMPAPGMVSVSDEPDGWELEYFHALAEMREAWETWYGEEDYVR